MNYTLDLIHLEAITRWALNGRYEPPFGRDRYMRLRTARAYAGSDRLLDAYLESIEVPRPILSLDDIKLVEAWAYDQEHWDLQADCEAAVQALDPHLRYEALIFVQEAYDSLSEDGYFNSCRGEED